MTKKSHDFGGGYHISLSNLLVFSLILVNLNSVFFSNAKYSTLTYYDLIRSVCLIFISKLIVLYLTPSTAFQDLTSDTLYTIIRSRLIQSK